MIFAAQQPERRPVLIGTLLSWSTICSAVSGSLVALLFLALGSHRPAGLTPLDCLLIGTGIFSIAVFEAGNGFLTACGWLRQRALPLLWAPWLYAGLLVIIALTAGLTVPRAAIVWCAVHLIWAVCVWRPAIREAGIARPTIAAFLESIRFGVRAWIGTLSDFLNFRLDQLLMGFLGRRPRSVSTQSRSMRPRCCSTSRTPSARRCCRSWRAQVVRVCTTHCKPSAGWPWSRWRRSSSPHSSRRRSSRSCSATRTRALSGRSSGSSRARSASPRCGSSGTGCSGRTLRAAPRSGRSCRSSWGSGLTSP